MINHSSLGVELQYLNVQVNTDFIQVDPDTREMLKAT